MKFGYTILYVKDVAQTVSFYEQAFNQTCKFVHESGYAELETGEAKLAFASLALAKSHGISFQELPLPGPAPSFEIAFVTDDVEGAFNRSLAAGAVEVQQPIKKPWGQLVGYVRDNNGYIIEICTPIS